MTELTDLEIRLGIAALEGLPVFTIHSHGTLTSPPKLTHVGIQDHEGMKMYDPFGDDTLFWGLIDRYDVDICMNRMVATIVNGNSSVTVTFDSESKLYRAALECIIKANATCEPIRVLTVGDEFSPAVAIALKRLGRAAWNTTGPYLEDLEMDSSMRVVIKQGPENVASADPHIHLAPNHQDYTPNHRKQRRDKFKRSGR